MNSSDTRREERRKRLLAVDTILKIGDNRTTQFLLPNFYADRLVDFINAECLALVKRFEDANNTSLGVTDVIEQAKKEYEK